MFREWPFLTRSLQFVQRFFLLNRQFCSVGFESKVVYCLTVLLFRFQMKICIVFFRAQAESVVYSYFLIYIDCYVIPSLFDVLIINYEMNYLGPTISAKLRYCRSLGYGDCEARTAVISDWASQFLMLGHFLLFCSSRGSSMNRCPWTAALKAHSPVLFLWLNCWWFVYCLKTYFYLHRKIFF